MAKSRSRGTAVSVSGPGDFSGLRDFGVSGVFGVRVACQLATAKRKSRNLLNPRATNSTPRSPLPNTLGAKMGTLGEILIGIDNF